MPANTQLSGRRKGAVSHPSSPPRLGTSRRKCRRPMTRVVAIIALRLRPSRLTRLGTAPIIAPAAAAVQARSVAHGPQSSPPQLGPSRGKATGPRRRQSSPPQQGPSRGKQDDARNHHPRGLGRPGETESSDDGGSAELGKPPTSTRGWADQGKGCGQG